MLLLFTIITITFPRLLQRGPHPPRDDGSNRGQSKNSINELFEHLAKNLDQDQKDELQMIQSYAFDEGFKYYYKQDQVRKDKILAALLGMGEELDNQKGKENQRVEKDIEYFSSLNYTDKDIVLTKISQDLEKNLNDTTKQFNSKLVLNIIELQIESFKTNPDRSIQATWNTKQYINKQNKEEQELEEIEYQIQELLDQGLSDQDLKSNLTQFINQYFNDSQNLQGDLNNIDQLIQEISQQEKQKNSTQKQKNMRQELRQIIRQSLKEGKSEQEIIQIVQDYLSKSDYNNLNQNEKEEIQQIIQNEILKYKRQQDYNIQTSNNSTSTKTDDQDLLDKNINNQSKEYNYIYYIGGFSAFLLVLIIIFVLRRYQMKKKQSNQIRFKIQESQQEVEQIE